MLGGNTTIRRTVVTFLYQNYTFNPANPWEGLFRSELLVNVRL